jgi:putative ABC transport system substrate-binding protein
MDAMAQQLNVHAVFLDVRSPDELDAALAAAKAPGSGVVLSDEQVISVGDSPGRIADFALRNQLPSIGPVSYADVGGLIGYGVAVYDVMRQSMALVDRILKGAKPADLPIQQATTFDLVVNLKTAKALDLRIPPAVLARANRAIE